MSPNIDEHQFLETDAIRVSRSAPLPRLRRHSLTAASGRSLSYLRFDDGSQNIKPKVVFLHGAGLNAHTFDPTILALDLPAISVDLPGHGKSDWREDGNYAPFVIAHDVLELIEQVAELPVHLVGHSLGGLTAAKIAEINSGAIKTLTLLDITPGVSPSKDAGSINDFISGKKSFDSVSEIVDRAIEFGIGHDRTALTRGVTLNTRMREDGKLEWTHHLAHLDSARTAPIPTFPYLDLWKPLQQLSAPVLQVRGETGMVTEALLEEWRVKLPNASDETIAGGHNLHEHNPVALAETIKKYVS